MINILHYNSHYYNSICYISSSVTVAFTTAQDMKSSAVASDFEEQQEPCLFMEVTCLFMLVKMKEAEAELHLDIKDSMAHKENTKCTMAQW